jgi:hypothetical protein
MKLREIRTLAATVGLIAVLSTPALAGGGGALMAHMAANHEAPVCSATGSGTFQATINEDETAVEYQLTYTLEGTVTQSHIHLGQVGVSGGISIWLCQTTGFADPTGLAPTCPAEGTVSGTFTRANVIGPVNQGIAGSAGGASEAEFAEVLRNIRRGLTYANVHSDICPSGEARGQILSKK